MGEACLILIIYGLVFHIGMSAVRFKLDNSARSMYKPGAIYQTNKLQLLMGVVSLVIGLIGQYYESK